MKEVPIKAVVLISGGMDSCVTVAIARQEYQVCGLHVNYHQRTEARELKAFSDICDHYQIQERLIIDAEYFGQIGGSSLTDERIDVSPANLDGAAIPTSYVPFRNANLLSAAVSWAETIGAARIFIGAVEEDSSGYPDCRKSFFEAFNVLIRLGSRPGSDLQIETPIIDLNKAAIIREGTKLAAPFELTWSCYQNSDLACGVCDSCALRLRGFRQAGAPDPIRYAPPDNGVTA